MGVKHAHKHGVLFNLHVACWEIGGTRHTYALLLLVQNTDGPFTSNNFEKRKILSADFA